MPRGVRATRRIGPKLALLGHPSLPPFGRRVIAVALIPTLLAIGCGRSGGGRAEILSTPPAAEITGSFRALAGVSVGAYGALNLGTKYPELFGVIGALGGPCDMEQLLKDLVRDTLDVKPNTIIPEGVGGDFTFDHFPSNPDRGTRVSMLKDLVVALGNPFLHHRDLARQYLASDSEPAQRLRDDAFGSLTLPPHPRGFFDGGDLNGDGLRQIGEFPGEPVDVLLLDSGSVEALAGRPADAVLGGRGLVDLSGNGVFDVGDAIVVNASESFTDLKGHRRFDPPNGEQFLDYGLDGVRGTRDYGEANGRFDWDPDRPEWLAEDPLSRIRSLSREQILRQRIYMDVGTEDEFGFETHYLNLVAALEEKGIAVEIGDGFTIDCASGLAPMSPYYLLRYPGGHTGIVEGEDLLEGDICGSSVVWLRILTVLQFLDQSFPGGRYGVRGATFVGDRQLLEIASPILARPGGAAPRRRVLIYLPPAHFDSEDPLPVVYFMAGYGQDPGDYVRVGDLMSLLIFTGQIQNMYVVFLPGTGGIRGTFHLNRRIPEEQVPGLSHTSGRYEDSIIEDLIPFIEEVVLPGRIKQ